MGILRLNHLDNFGSDFSILRLHLSGHKERQMSLERHISLCTVKDLLAPKIPTSRHFPQSFPPKVSRPNFPPQTFPPYLSLHPTPKEARARLRAAKQKSKISYLKR